MGKLSLIVFTLLSFMMNANANEKEMIIEIDGQLVEKIKLPQKAGLIIVEELISKQDHRPANEGYIEDDIDLEVDELNEKINREISSTEEKLNYLLENSEKEITYSNF